jgi:hypothetical protein
VTVLDEAAELVNGSRAEAYGPPGANHDATAAMFAIYLERRYGVTMAFDAQDVCWFNVIQKIARDAHEPRRDNLVDVAGYVENLSRIRTG